MPAEHSDSAAVVVAKAAPPISISLATIAGIQVSDLVLWITLIYTTLLVIKTLWQMWRMYKDSCALKDD
jgi:hypothetical protein